MTTAPSTPTASAAIAATTDLPRQYTPDDVIAMEEHGLFELVDGQLLEKRMGMDSTTVVGEVTGQLWHYNRLARAGHVMPEQSYQAFPRSPGQVRRPDVSFLSNGRVPLPRPSGHLPIRPDLAVEVVSPTDNAYELQDKLADYRSADVPLVWVVWPHVQLVQQHRPNQPIVEFRPGDTLTGGDVLPGLAVAVADLFPAPPADRPPA